MKQELTYQLRKRLGLCGRCGKHPAEPGKVLCASCNKKAIDVSRKHRANNTQCLRRIRREREEAGLCIVCKKPLEGSGHTRCPECLYYKRMKEKIKRRRIKKGTWTGEFLGKTEKEKIAEGVILQWLLEKHRQELAGK